MKTLVLFLDNLHADLVTAERMPFLHGLAKGGAVARTETVLGYSNAIRNTIFTGTNPRTHGKWSKYRYDPAKSPFKSLGAYKAINLLPGGFLQRCARYACTKGPLRTHGRKMGYGQLSFENVPLDLLPNFDFTEEDITKERGPVPTMFQVLEEAGVPYRYLSLPLLLNESHLKQIEAALATSELVVVYLYNLDAAGHRLGVEGTGFHKVQRHTDAFLKRIVGRAERSWAGFQTFVFSDHGMSDVKNYVNLRRVLKRQSPGHQKDYLVFIDSTMARFWYRNDKGRDEAHQVMAKVGHGRWLTEQDRVRFGVDFPGSDYGEEVYLLEHDTVFHPAYVSWMKPTGMHGFSCDHPSQDGLFLWNDGTGRKLPGRIHMTDLAPTILTSLGVDPPKTCEGHVHR